MQPSWEEPQGVTLEGSFVRLLPLDIERDAKPLYFLSHGTPEKEAVWQFPPAGPFDNVSDIQSWMQRE
jgi:hypothetical protein